MKLILELKGEEWVNTESGHVSCDLHKALQEVFLATGNREFRVEDRAHVIGETYEGE